MKRALRLANKIPLSAAGWTAVVVVAVGFMGGWLLGWTELMVVATGMGTALLIGALVVLRKLSLSVARTIAPDRVTVGEAALGYLVVTNGSTVPSLSVVAHDRLGDMVVPISIPPLGPRATHEAMYPLPTDRRSVLKVGPTVIARTDPMRLFRSEIRHSEIDTLWVHPRKTMLAAPSAGFAKDLEGPTSENSPKGDVAFHALREYVFGDDLRHVHWRSTARTGTLMIRDYVDNRRPVQHIILDGSDASYQGGGDFELAVEVVASIGVSALLAGQPISIAQGREPIASSRLTPSPDAMLDVLAGVESTPTPTTPEEIARSVHRATGASILVLVTGPVRSETLLRLLAPVRRVPRIAVVRCWEGEVREPEVLPRAKLIDIADLGTFRVAWNRYVS